MGCEAMEDLKVQGTKEDGRSGRHGLQMIFVRQVLDHPARIDQSADPTIMMSAGRRKPQATTRSRQDRTWPAAAHHWCGMKYERCKVKPAKVRTNHNSGMPLLNKMQGLQWLAVCTCATSIITNKVGTLAKGMLRSSSRTLNTNGMAKVRCCRHKRKEFQPAAAGAHGQRKARAINNMP